MPLPFHIQVVNAAIIVDPSVKQVVATARDQICSWDIAADKIVLESGCLKEPEAFDLNPDSDGIVNCKTLPPTGFQDEKNQPDSGVSCLHPWAWAERQSAHLSSSLWHPLRHAVIVAIESSAARDRQLFPNLGEIQDKPIDMDNMQSSSVGSPAKRRKTNIEKVRYLLFASNETVMVFSLPL